MISWRDSLALSRKRWKRKRIFGSLKYSAPLFLLTMLTIVTLNVTFVLIERVNAVSGDSDFPHTTHLRISIPPKTEVPISASQLAALRKHPAVRHVMTSQSWFQGFYTDMGEPRYATIPFIYGYSKEFFDLYRKLPPEKSDPTCVPVLLGRDLLSLTWSPEQKSFVRNQKEEMQRWLGRTFTVYLNPFGIEGVPTTFKVDQLDYARNKKTVMDKRKQQLAELEKSDPDLARLQDALFMKLQVVGFVRDLTESGTTCVIPEEIAGQVAELSLLRKGKKLKPKNDDNLNNINLIVTQDKKREVENLAKSLGLKVHDRSSDGVIARLFKGIKENEDLQLTLYILVSLYSLAMMVVIYQLLSGQVKDSIREIGLLRCIGARRSDIMRIFIVMNLMRLTRIYISCLVCAYIFLFGFGYWLAGMLNMIDPENLASENIPDFLIHGIAHFTPFWLMGPGWMALMPLLLLVPIALGAAAIPIWHVMGVQPSEALRD